MSGKEVVPNESQQEQIGLEVDRMSLEHKKLPNSDGFEVEDLIQAFHDRATELVMSDSAN